MPEPDAMPAMCDDCAFRDGSPERGEMMSWAINLEVFKAGTPFYCHKGMPQDEKGDYKPELDETGKPVGARICGGWAACSRGDMQWPCPMHVLTTEKLDAMCGPDDGEEAEDDAVVCQP